MKLPPVRVLVVDDAVVVRRLVARILEEHPAFDVPTTAANGRLALAKLEQGPAPDAIVLDIEMPELDGLATLKELRRTHPRLPVVMFSTLTEAGATAALQALALGATDYVTKPSNTGSFDVAKERVREELVPKLLTFTGRTSAFGTDHGAPPPLGASSRPSAGRLGAPLRLGTTQAESAGERPPPPTPEVIAIGASTGGPNALATVLAQLAPVAVPVVVTQHIPPVFSTMLAQRLDKLAAMPVREAAAGDRLAPGTVWIAPGDHHLVLQRRSAGVDIFLTQAPPENSCRPSVDVMFRSVAEVYGGAVLAVILTGMGYDGLRGVDAVHRLGAQVVAQDQASSVVWGMPGAVVDAGLADAVVPVDGVAAEIASRLGASRPAATAGRSSLLTTTTAKDS